MGIKLPVGKEGLQAEGTWGSSCKLASQVDQILAEKKLSFVALEESGQDLVTSGNICI